MYCCDVKKRYNSTLSSLAIFSSPFISFHERLVFLFLSLYLSRPVQMFSFHIISTPVALMVQVLVVEPHVGILRSDLLHFGCSHHYES